MNVRSFKNNSVGLDTGGSAIAPVSMSGTGVAKLEIRTPLDDVRDVFLKIKDGIQDLVANSKEALGIEKKQELRDAQGRRDADIKGEDTDVPGTAPDDRKSFLESLKDAFEGITDNQTAKDVLKLFLLAAGFFALTKLAEKFKDKLIPILKFIREDLFPSLDELKKDTEDSLIGLGGLSKLGLFFFFKL